MFGGKAAKEGIETDDAPSRAIARRRSTTRPAGSSTCRRKRSTSSTQEEDLHRHDLRGAAPAHARGAARRPRKDRREGTAGATSREKPQKPTKECEVDFDVKETGQKKQIAGYDAHETIDHDHRAREGQDARGQRRHRDDHRHVARPADPGAEGARRLRHALLEAAAGAGGRRDVGRADGGGDGDVSAASSKAMERMQKEGAKLQGTPLDDDHDLRGREVKDQLARRRRAATAAAAAAASAACSRRR